MKSAVAQIFLPQFHLPYPHLPPPSTLTTTHRTFPLPLNLRRPNHRFPPKSHSPTPQTTTTTTTSDDHGIPIEHVKTLAKFKSRHNYIRVLQVSRAADHPLAGSRLLLLDGPGNIHSISFLFRSLTHSYFDVFATLPPILPPGPIALLGFGAGTAARIILELYPESVIHGWELDAAVIAVAREYFWLDKLEKKYAGRLFIHVGDALNAGVKGGFAGVLVDLFSKGRVIPELQDETTWERLRGRLRRGGRVMVNVGGSCVEPEDKRRDGSVVMAETLRAMGKVFRAEEMFVLSIDDRRDDSAVAMTGGFPDSGEEWKKGVRKRALKDYVDMWKPYESVIDRVSG